jgi:hypothetical protein
VRREKNVECDLTGRQAQANKISTRAWRCGMFRRQNSWKSTGKRPRAIMQDRTSKLFFFNTLTISTAPAILQKNLIQMQVDENLKEEEKHQSSKKKCKKSEKKATDCDGRSKS